MKVIQFGMMGLSFYFFLATPLHAATVTDDSFDLDIIYSKKMDETKERTIHMRKGSDTFSSVRLFYRPINSKLETDFMDFKVEDVASLYIVGPQLESGLLASVVMTDQGGIFVGYIESEKSLLNDRLSAMTLFKDMESIQFQTDPKDIRDSKPYMTEYSTEFLWKDVEVSDFVKYIVIKKTKEGESRAELLQKIIKISEDSVELELTSSLELSPVPKKILFKEYPDRKSVRPLKIKRIGLKPIWFFDRMDYQTLSVDAFLIEWKDSDSGDIYRTYLEPSLIPLAWSDGLNGVLLKTQPRESGEYVTQYISEVKRLRVNPESDALMRLSDDEKNNRVNLARSLAIDFLTLIKDGKFDASSMDQFVSLDDLFLVVDGFPHDYREKKTLQEKINENEDFVDQNYDELEEKLAQAKMELENLEKKILECEEELKLNPESLESKDLHKALQQELFQLNLKKEEVLQVLSLLNERKSVGRETVKSEKRQKLEETFSHARENQKDVLSDDLNRLFQEYIPGDISPKDAMSVVSFTLLAPDRAVITKPENSTRIQLKMIQGQWKIVAIVR